MGTRTGLGKVNKSNSFFVIYSHSSLLGTERFPPSQKEISSINVNFSYKSVTSTLFSELLLCLLFLKIIGSKQFLCKIGIFGDGIFHYH